MAEIWDNLGLILAVTFIFGGLVICGTVGSIMKNWRKVRVSEHEAALKQSMIERGMSVEEIEKVLRAGKPSQQEQEADD